MKHRLPGLSAETAPDFSQEALFEVPQEPESFTGNGACVPVRQRAQHLVEALNLIADASKLAGLKSAAQTPRRAELEQHYGTELPRVLENTPTSRERVMQSARWEVAYGGGYFDLVDAATTERDASVAMAEEDFGRFYQQYHGREHRDDRDAYRNLLRKSYGLQ